MIRTPLRPLARILEARRKGESPDAIERENTRMRHEQMRDEARQRAEGRLLLLGCVFVLGFLMIGARMGLLSVSEAHEPRASAAGASISAMRADIVDRQGRILATNFETHALYAQPPQMIDPMVVADKLVAIFPDLDRARLVKDFTGNRKFLWIKRKISPEQKQAVFDIGDPGLMFGPREMRLYPNGRLASHILGGASYGKEGVRAAEIIGIAGAELFFDKFLRDPAMGGAPLQLSIDLTVQAASERVLYGGMKLMNAKGATSVLMDVHTGEVLSLVSLPDFDPHDRPRPLLEGDQADSPLFNRAVQGVYELGSTFKIFTAVQAIDLGLVNRNTLVSTEGPVKWGNHRINDYSKHDPLLTVSNVVIESSNIGTARISQMIGVDRHRSFLDEMGMLKASGLEVLEAAGGRPLLPKKWSELSTMTISYGHGLSVTPIHLAAGYAMIANGGYKIRPTILKQTGPQHGERVMSAMASEEGRAMLRAVVTEGTASMADVVGYPVAGKTGTADKPKPTGGYYKEKTIATFAAMFPAKDPQYVLIVTLDEPVETSGEKPRRTAGWTAVPVASEMIGRIAPLLGLRPEIELTPLSDVTLTSSN